MFRRLFVLSGLLSLTACPGPNPGLPDGGEDAGEFVLPTPFAVPLSSAGPDQLQAVAPGPDGTFYAAGYAAATPTGAKLLTVVKLNGTSLDTSFGGNDGIASTSFEFRGGSDEI